MRKKLATYVLWIITIAILMIPFIIYRITGQYMMLYRYLVTKQYAMADKSIYQLIVLIPLLIVSILVIRRLTRLNYSKMDLISILVNTVLIIAMIILSLIDVKAVIIYFPLCLSIYAAIILTYVIFAINRKP